ncbi:MAG: OB-fold nucleic acid binding domain-containing protein, partial [Bacteroidota bacterium]
SHSAAYAYLAFQTGWLKAHYPAEFLAANMTAELNDQAKIVALIDEAKRYGITVQPPDVNRSMATFIAEGRTIYFGMAGIKGVGVGAVEAIVEARSDGAFVSYYDFAARVEKKVLNRRLMESLVCAGAFDCLGHGHRAQLFEAIDTALHYGSQVQDDALSSSGGLFGSEDIERPKEPALPRTAEWPDGERLRREREVLSFYISGHPLQEYALAVNSFSTINLSRPDAEMSGKPGRVCGMIGEIRTRLDRRENTIAFVKLEQFHSSMELIFWSDKYKQFAEQLKVGAVIVAVGKCEVSGESIKLTVDDVLSIDQAEKRFARGYVVRVDPDKVQPRQLEDLKSRCNTSDATHALTFIVAHPEGNRQYSTMTRVASSTSMTKYLCETFGESNVLIDTER